MAIGAVAMAFAMSGRAQAMVVSYADRAIFEAALVSPTTFDFNSETEGQQLDGAGGYDFGPFSISDSGAGSDVYIRDSSSGSASSGIVNGTKFVRYNENSSGNVALSVTFDSTVRAFGFDYSNVDPGTVVDFTVSISGFSTTFPGVLASDTSGFFGLISTDMAITETAFSFFDDPPAGSGVLGLDNFTWSSTLAGNAAPLPGALPLFGSGLVILGLIARRRKKRALA